MIKRWDFWLDLSSKRPEFLPLVQYWEPKHIRDELAAKAEPLYRKAVRRWYKKHDSDLRVSAIRQRRLSILRRQQDKKATARAGVSRRAAARINAIPCWFGEFDALVFLEAAKLCQVRELQTGIQWHIDHMVPLRAADACGLHCAENIQVIPAAMNLEKNNSMTLTIRNEWLKIS